MMKIPRVKNAAFGIPLDLGTKIIGLAHLVLYTLCFLMIMVREREDDHDTGHHDTGNSSSTSHHGNDTSGNGTAGNHTTMDDLEDELVHDYFLDLSASYFNDFALVIQITFAVFLVIGVYRKNLDYIMSWVLLQLANMTFSFFFLVVYFVAVFRIYASEYIIYLICEEITVSLVVGYCVLVVNSYVEESTKRTNDREEQLSPIVINSAEDRR